MLADAGGISTWRTLVTYDDLAEGAAGKSCGLGSFTSVGYLRAQPIIGGSCAHAGVVGLFARQTGAWRLVGPPLARPFRALRAEVLGLGTSGNATSALVALTGASGTELLAAWSGPGATWSTSPPLVIGQNEEVASFGVGPGRALFAFLEGTSGAERLALAQAGRAAWQQLPPPPQGTETVAFGTKGSTDALVASGTKFSAWSLKAGSKRWAEDQVTDVAIQYGSSS